MYRHLVNNGFKATQEIWHMKIPLKIKIFMWYLKRGVVLTKDNLARRNWNGNKACCFCSKPETIQHLFVECHYAKILWRAIHLVLGIPPLVNIELLFNNWSKQGGHKHNILLLTGAAAICWSIWLTRNDTVFNNCKPKTFLQVLFRGTYWLRSWALLRHTNDQRERLVEACQLLESSALQLFASHGWPSILRIGL